SLEEQQVVFFLLLEVSLRFLCLVCSERKQEKWWVFLYLSSMLSKPQLVSFTMILEQFPFQAGTTGLGLPGVLVITKKPEFLWILARGLRAAYKKWPNLMPKIQS
uniref:Uncharacterized protein n=1 Tax=Anolis carolinensis TaxID=28377 RepID=A0A803T5F2_ANOCA